MAKKKTTDEGFPYFKFFISKWSTGNIQQCSFSAQGLFMNLCVLYWGQRGELYMSKMKKRFQRKQKYFEELISEGIIKLNSDEIEISFLDEQLTELGLVSEKNRDNAFKRWNQTKQNATASESQCQTDANAMPEEKRREEKKRQEESVHAHVEYVENPRRIIAETDFPNKNEIFEEIFSDARFMTDLKLVHPKKNIEKAWGECWIYHSQRPRPPAHTWEWKQKLSSWLTIMDEEKNGTTKTTTNRNINHVASVAEDFARRHGGKQGSGN